MIRVVVADDQALVRDGLRLILATQDDIDVCGEAADGVEVVQVARRLRPDVVLMDVQMPHVDGLEATRQVVAATAGATKVLVLTTFDRERYLFDALHAGASGFLLKSTPRMHLLHAVRAAAADDAVLDPVLTRRLMAEYASRPPTSAGLPEPLRRLSPRELDVLREVVRGLSNAEVAVRLVIGETTVKSHLASALRKLGLRDRVQAVILGYECGLVRPGDATV